MSEINTTTSPSTSRKFHVNDRVRRSLSFNYSTPLVNDSKMPRPSDRPPKPKRQYHQQNKDDSNNDSFDDMNNLVNNNYDPSGANLTNITSTFLQDISLDQNNSTANYSVESKGPFEVSLDRNDSLLDNNIYNPTTFNIEESAQMPSSIKNTLLNTVKHGYNAAKGFIDSFIHDDNGDEEDENEQIPPSQMKRTKTFDYGKFK